MNIKKIIVVLVMVLSINNLVFSDTLVSLGEGLDKKVKELPYYALGYNDISPAQIKLVKQKKDKKLKAYDLYSKGYDLYKAKKYVEAINYFVYSKEKGYDIEENNKFIFYCIDSLGYQAIEDGDFETAISFYKLYLYNRSNVNVEQNILYSYLHLSKKQNHDQAISTILHAYKMILKYSIKDSNVHSLATELASRLQKKPLLMVNEIAIEFIEFAQTIKDDAYSYQSLGMLYEQLNKNNKAIKNYKVVVDRYSDSSYYEVCFGRYEDLTVDKLKFDLKYSFDIKRNQIESSDYLTIKLELPQEFKNQKIESTVIKFNGKKIKYNQVEDQLKNRYAEIKVSDDINNGKNSITIESIIKRDSVRLLPEELKLKDIRDYKNDSFYKLHTRSTETHNFDHPEIQKIIKELSPKVKNKNLEEMVDIIYNYVMNKLNYNLNVNNLNIGTDRVFINNLDGNCEDYAVLTSTILRAFGIPSECFKAETLNSEVGHAWPVFYTPDLIPTVIDPTWGDTSGLPQIYYLFDSGLNLVVKKGYDSEIMYGNKDIEVYFYGDGSVNIEGSERLVSKF